MSDPDRKPEAREVRDFVEGIELRAAPEGSKSPGTMVGYAAMYGKYSCDLGYFREKLAPGCFDRALARCDVRCLRNHDPNMLLGRSSAGTLRLVSDELGLRMECDLPDTSVGRDTAESIRRGDMQGQSFSFTTNIATWDTSSEPYIRTVDEVGDLFDVGPVTFPAYEETSVAMRSFRAEQEQRSAPPAPPDPGPPPYTLESERDSARLRLAEVS